jgi:hypothetical protein
MIEIPVTQRHEWPGDGRPGGRLVGRDVDQFRRDMLIRRALDAKGEIRFDDWLGQSGVVKTAAA